jgi:uncharacterized protein (TIGR02145 family)
VAIQNIFREEIAGYNIMGHFLKILTLLIVLIPTLKAQEDTINVAAGWNMIGSLYAGIPSDILRSEPESIIVSSFYAYNPLVGYESKDTLKKGGGYWVEVSENGQIFFAEKPINNFQCGQSVEYDGNLYNTVLIGDQCWFKENLDIGLQINGIQSQTDNGTIEKYCYNDSVINCNIYGGLYQWNEAMLYTTKPGSQGICPDGWHVPTYTEFQVCSTYVNGSGNSLKAIGQGTGGGAGTNTSGFSALLSGSRLSLGTFASLSFAANFWNSTEKSLSNAYLTQLYYSNSVIISFDLRKDYGFSIRCIMN